MWNIDEIKKCIGEHTSHYSIVVIDIDYLIRFCMRFRDEEVNSIINNITDFFQSTLVSDSYIWKAPGDEYLILYNNRTIYETEKILKEIRKSFKRQRFARDCNRKYSNIRMTFSAGIAGNNSDNLLLDEIIRKATVALFQAKAFRRDRIVVFSEAEKVCYSRVLYNPYLKIETIIGEYGRIGCVSHPVLYKDALLWEPQAIDVDYDDNLYIVDQNNHSILKCDGKYVRRVAGCGEFGFRGDHEPGTNAYLNKPTGIAIYDNTLYITDTGNDAVRRLDLRTNVIDTIAGMGMPGYSGDGGFAFNALLNKPGGAAIDHDGNLFINDIANNVIRKIDTNNIITTYAGTSEYGYEGDNGPSVYATFAEIYGIGIDKCSGDLYIADYFNHCIRIIEASTETIRTIAGDGTPGYEGDGGDPLKAKLNRPVAVCTDKEGNIYIAESGNSCVRIIVKAEGKIYTLVGDGMYGIGTSGYVNFFRLANPNGLAVNSKNQLFILDGANNRICMIDLNNIGR